MSGKHYINKNMEINSMLLNFLLPNNNVSNCSNKANRKSKSRFIKKYCNSGVTEDFLLATRSSF